MITKSEPLIVTASYVRKQVENTFRIVGLFRYIFLNMPNFQQLYNLFPVTQKWRKNSSEKGNKLTLTFRYKFANTVKSIFYAFIEFRWVSLTVSEMFTWKKYIISMGPQQHFIEIVGNYGGGPSIEQKQN